MNFYKHHIGDYAQATAHLSFVEDAAYSRCLRKYYAEEAPLPIDLKAVQRLVGARSREERDAVETVLAEFFEMHEDGWHNKRADVEIGKANAQAETNRQIAEEREAKRRARKEHESLNAPSTNRPPAPAVEREPSQTPDTRHQTPDATTSGKGEAPASPRPTRKAPAGFAIGEHLLAWASANAPGVDLDLETAKLRDYTFPRAISDWDGAWRNWVRRAFEDLARRRPASRAIGAVVDTATRNAEAARLLGIDTQEAIPNA